MIKKKNFIYYKYPSKMILLDLKNYLGSQLVTNCTECY